MRKKTLFIIMVLLVSITPFVLARANDLQEIVSAPVSGPVSYPNKGFNKFRIEGFKLLKEEKEIGPRDAQLSQNKSNIAYVDFNETDAPSIKVYDLTNNKNTVSKTFDGNPNQYILNWSDNNGYIVMTEKSQQPYRQSHTIYKYSKNDLQKVIEFKSYGNTMKWNGDRLFYITTKDKCVNENCIPSEFWLTSVNVSTLKTKDIKIVFTLEDNPPIFKEIDLNQPTSKVSYEKLRKESLGTKIVKDNFISEFKNNEN